MLTCQYCRRSSSQLQSRYPNPLNEDDAIFRPQILLYTLHIVIVNKVIPNVIAKPQLTIIAIFFIESFLTRISQKLDKNSSSSNLPTLGEDRRRRGGSWGGVNRLTGGGRLPHILPSCPHITCVEFERRRSFGEANGDRFGDSSREEDEGDGDEAVVAGGGGDTRRRVDGAGESGGDGYRKKLVVGRRRGCGERQGDDSGESVEPGAAAACDSISGTVIGVGDSGTERRAGRRGGGEEGSLRSSSCWMAR